MLCGARKRVRERKKERVYVRVWVLGFKDAIWAVIFLVTVCVEEEEEG